MKPNHIFFPTPGRTWFIAAVLALGVCSTTCLARQTEPAPAPDSTTLAYSMGKLAATTSSKLEVTAQAVRDAVAQMKFVVVSENSDSLASVFVVRTATDKKISIHLERIGDQTTRLEIRVGVFGDRATSMALYDKIKASL